TRRREAPGHLRGQAALLLHRRPQPGTDPLPEGERVRRTVARRARERHARPLVVRLVALVLAPTPAAAPLPAFVVRLVGGAVLIGFGESKFVPHAREARAFDRYGLPAPDVFTYSTGTLELVLGVALLLGLVTRLTALGLAGNMVGAIATGGRVDGGFVNLGL